MYMISQGAEEADAGNSVRISQSLSAEFQIGVCVHPFFHFLQGSCQRVHGDYSRAPLRLSPLSSFC